MALKMKLNPPKNFISTSSIMMMNRISLRVRDTGLRFCRESLLTQDMSCQEIMQTVEFDSSQIVDHEACGLNSISSWSGVGSEPAMSIIIYVELAPTSFYVHCKQRHD